MRKEKLIRIVGMITPEGWANFLDKIYRAIHTYGVEDLAYAYQASVGALIEHREGEKRLKEREGFVRNPWNPNKFEYELLPTHSLAKQGYGPLQPGKRPYRPGVGFFPRSVERGLKEPATFYRAYAPLPPQGKKEGPHRMKVKWPDKKNPIQWIEYYVYKHYKVGVPLDNGQVDVTDVALWKKLAIPLIFENVGNLLRSKGVGAALHNINIVFLPKIPYMTRQFHIEGLPPVVGDATGCYLGAGGFEIIRIATGISTLGPGTGAKKAGMNVIDDFVKVTRNKILELGPSWRKGFGKTPEEDAVLGELSITIITLLHELGHRVDKKCLVEEKPKLFQIWMEYKDDNPVSAYAAVNPAEWFAEAWVAWLIDGLVYNKEVKAAFEDILQVVPSEFEPQSFSAFTNKVVQMMDDAFTALAPSKGIKLSPIKKGDSFTMTVNYVKGPEKKLKGYFVGIRKNRPLPTLGYRQEKSGQIYHFTCFPNREIKSIKVEPGKESK